MPFGSLAAPFKFQFLMDQALLQFPHAVAFVDDLTVKGHSTDWESLWQRTLEVLFALAVKGFKFNLRKCKFLVEEASLLGLKVCKRVYSLGEKCLLTWDQV